MPNMAASVCLTRPQSSGRQPFRRARRQQIFRPGDDHVRATHRSATHARTCVGLARAGSVSIADAVPLPIGEAAGRRWDPPASRTPGVVIGLPRREAVISVRSAGSSERRHHRGDNVHGLRECDDERFAVDRSRRSDLLVPGRGQESGRHSGVEIIRTALPRRGSAMRQLRPPRHHGDRVNSQSSSRSRGRVLDVAAPVLRPESTWWADVPTSRATVVRSQRNGSTDHPDGPSMTIAGRGRAIASVLA